MSVETACTVAVCERNAAQRAHAAALQSVQEVAAEREAALEEASARVADLEADLQTAVALLPTNLQTSAQRAARRDASRAAGDIKARGAAEVERAVAAATTALQEAHATNARASADASRLQLARRDAKVLAAAAGVEAAQQRVDAVKAAGRAVLNSKQVRCAGIKCAPPPVLRKVVCKHSTPHPHCRDAQAAASCRRRQPPAVCSLRPRRSVA